MTRLTSPQVAERLGYVDNGTSTNSVRLHRLIAMVGLPHPGSGSSAVWEPMHVALAALRERLRTAGLIGAHHRRGVAWRAVLDAARAVPLDQWAAHVVLCDTRTARVVHLDQLAAEVDAMRSCMTVVALEGLAS